MTFTDLPTVVAAMVTLVTLRLGLPILVLCLINVICCRVLGLQTEAV